MNANKKIAYIITESDTTAYLEPVKIIEESTVDMADGSTKKRVVAEGILQTADEKNRNAYTGRIAGNGSSGHPYRR